MYESTDKAKDSVDALVLHIVFLVVLALTISYHSPNYYADGLDRYVKSTTSQPQAHAILESCIG